jgi:RND family efflux transporter MFP subunit
LLIAAVLAVTIVAVMALPMRVEVAKVTRGPILAAFGADGYVESESVDIAPMVMGPVESIPVQEGERVAAGTSLVRLTSHDAEATAAATAAALTAAIAEEQRASQNVVEASAEHRLLESGAAAEDVAQARLRLAQAKETASASQRNLARATQLYAGGAISLAAFEDAQTQAKVSDEQTRQALEAYNRLVSGARPEELSAAAARHAAANASLRAARALAAQAAAAARGARFDLSHTTVVAPIAGTVDRIWVRVGALVSPQTRVVTLASSRALRVSVDLNEEDASKVQPGMSVTVEIPGYPGRPLGGRVVRIASTATTPADVTLRSRTMRAEVIVSGDSTLLKSGMRVDVKGQGIVSLDALKIPSDALAFVNGQNAVYVVRNGVACVQLVKVGYVDDVVAEVLEGLKPGDEIVVGSHAGVRDGRRVRVTNVVSSVP